MSWFNRKKEMNEREFNSEEDFFEEEAEEIPVNDRRRFNEEGERVTIDDEPEREPAAEQTRKSADLIRLENELAEVRRRAEVAENKLVDVQRRFDQAKANLEKETAEMRQRLTKNIEQRAKQGQFDFLTTLLPVLDNLNLAIEAGEKATAEDGDDSNNNLFDGVKGTARSFEQALMNVGVRPIAAVGEKFDPQLHEAVDTAEVEPELDGIITAEYARGYTFGDRLLRPARVQVGKAAAQKANAE